VNDPNPAPAGRPTWAEVDLAALRRNYRALKGRLDGPPSSPLVIEHPRLIPVIKADAYGHGAVPVAKALAAEGAPAFAVAIVEEAVALRRAGIGGEILVLQGAWPGQEPEVVEHGLEAAVSSPEALARLDVEARRRSREVRVHIKVDTGMARLGIAWDRIDVLLSQLQRVHNAKIAGVFSHLACAEESDDSFTTEQIRRFRIALGAVRASGFDPGEIHLANSAGLLYVDSLWASSARAGIALYGYPPAPERCPLALERVLTWKTRLGRIHPIQPGESVGYNRRFRASRMTRAATLPVGYADGYRRSLSGQGRVIVRDRWADVLGAVSMDLIVVDVTGIPDIREGEEAILLGQTNSCRFDAESWAALLGTIPYEVLCGISPRVPRVYLDSE
jgi:alanine racemase